jgi:uncharacterized protein YyaL (SSP411 family)
LLIAAPAPALAQAPPPEIEWRDWSDDLFAQAKQDGRFVLLDLGAVWCHWCHVMEETTYRDADVVRLVRDRFIAVRVDQDARPDLSNRYEDYGWPATIVFDASGQELVKFSGYIPPRRMASLLQGIVEDPTPGPSAVAEALLPPAGAAMSPALHDELEKLLVARYDNEHRGWGFVKKYLDWDSVEHCLRRAREGDADAERMARETLAVQLRLLDPVWGGVYQYSHGGGWDNPHFEKIMLMQAENLRIYALAYGQWRDPEHLRAAREIVRYLRGFLQSPDGAFYVSQDADLVQGEHAGEYFTLGDPERRAKGIPRVDPHTYTRETAWAANAFAVFHRATGDASALEDALRAARWILAKRSLPGGGFRHDAEDTAGPYMGDAVAAGRAFLSLFEVTGDRAWLGRAEETAAFIARTFRREGIPGFVTAAPSKGLAPLPQRDENVLMARFGAGLACHTNQAEHRRLAEDAMRYLAVPDVARRFSTAGVLLADRDTTAAEPNRTAAH